ncbi:MAG: glycosyltransferase family 2 protein [Bacteroidetes bacterium]|nr:glycosyltransferase family 2 protein [Bacteroidota bacterium]
MTRPLLTIAIPTWNRAYYLSKNLYQLKKELSSVGSSQVEILVSDNCSSDTTFSVVTKYKENGLPISYHYNHENIGWGGNFLQCLKKAQGKYVLLLADDDLIVDRGLEKIINVLNSNILYGSITLNSYGYGKEFMQEKPLDCKKNNKKYEIYEDYLYATCLNNTLLSSTVINKDLINFDETVLESEKNLTHLRYILTASMKAEINYIFGEFIIAVKRDNSSSYQYSQVFVNELWNIYNRVFNDDGSNRIIRRVKRKFLISFYPRDFLTIDNYIIESQKEIMGNFNKHFSEITYYRYFFKIVLVSPYIIKKSLLILLTIAGKVISGESSKILSMAFSKLRK